MRRKRAGEKVFPFHRLFYAVLGVKNSFYTNQRKRWTNLKTQIFSVDRKIAFIKTRIIYENQPLIMLVGCPSRSFCRFWINLLWQAGFLCQPCNMAGDDAVGQSTKGMRQTGGFFSQRPKRRYKACAASALRTAPAHRLARRGQC
mgnify:FL=1